MDLTSLSAAVGGLKAATDIVKSLNEIDRGVDVNNKVIELQQVILSLQSNLLQVQSEQAEIVTENSQLRDEIAELKKQAELDEQYELHKIEEGVFVYQSKEDSGKPEHWLCTNCFGKKEKSVLHLYCSNETGQFYLCPSCDFRFTVASRYR